MTDRLLPFHRLLAARQRREATVSFPVTEDWLQGRTTFGGFIAACSVQAMRDVAGAAWAPQVRLVALQTNFVGPVGLGEMDVRIEVLREGKHLRQVQAVVSQAGQTAAVLMGVFGAGRETPLAPLAPQQPPVSVTPSDAPALPFRPGVTPNFTQHLEFRWAEGNYPFSGKPGWRTRVHARLRGESISEELLVVMLTDAAPTAALGQLSQRAPASSVTWALELAPLSGPAAADGYWRIDNETRAAAAGHVNDSTTLWTPSGELAAFGYQVVAVYA
ncbi:thioesterase family protein [Aquabacterium sp. A7-Y]|uniref:acyl-CoA thioesterase n=1 Tax=Aquabacterium sp. A7-Y TaxID=1349605 RepID=UPI00223CD728|nr:thioesterase family protein [Aquabacterium sp. A7-Y]MCW7536597.1 thioesterase family protein [Aquabacterium sp. A7-Y]